MFLVCHEKKERIEIESSLFPKNETLDVSKKELLLVKLLQSSFDEKLMAVLNTVKQTAKGTHP